MKIEDIKIGMKVMTCDGRLTRTVVAIGKELVIVADAEGCEAHCHASSLSPAAPRYEYAEIVVEHFGPRTVCKYRDCGATTFLNFAPRYGAVGYLFEVDGAKTIRNTPVAYKLRGDSVLVNSVPVEWLESGKAEAIHATHVVFRKEA
jgi:hypothetical protein